MLAALRRSSRSRTPAVRFNHETPVRLVLHRPKRLTCASGGGRKRVIPYKGVSTRETVRLERGDLTTAGLLGFWQL